GVVVPERFVLLVHVDGARYRAVVRWRKKERLGVQIY
ncbi:PilZ domain-containing protein, partial [Mesorhizobium loti]